ncbi:AlpA family transcriptional regulator [Comamonas aquatica]|uniref:helix-turn-helix transcriptional regulator n=1 Tax=Comamonas aquatica TaxID=225991 RepID=UPI002449F63C|nr:AlpA family transcriptional regulator [Comamonas aquatica]MDH1379323.1 AlpA family transcriptional regulator [Comamonas aquatica]MDH1639189.1 AlpA family transcriptional regulator [Comamonas aquatica]
MTQKKNAPAIQIDSQSAVATQIVATHQQQLTTDHRDQERLLRIRDVCHLTGLGRSTVYLKVREGSFPPPVQLHGTCVAWYQSQVRTWIATRPAVVAMAATGGHKNVATMGGMHA